jgi:hypothetical protein
LRGRPTALLQLYYSFTTAADTLYEQVKEVTEKGAQTASLHVVGRASFLSSKAANQDIDNFFDSLDKDPVHGAPHV